MKEKEPTKIEEWQAEYMFWTNIEPDTGFKLNDVGREKQQRELKRLEKEWEELNERKRP